MNILLKTLSILYYEFFKVGLFAVGGGLATVPFLKELTTRRDWFDLDMLSTMIAVAESTPGAIGVNVATYSGFQAGHTISGMGTAIIGAVVATIGLVTPAIMVITLVSKAYKKFKDHPLVQNGFYGVRPAVTGMIASAGLILLQAALLKGDVPAFSGFGTWIREMCTQVINWKSLVVFAAALFAVRKFKVHPILFIVIGGVLGALLSM